MEYTPATYINFGPLHRGIALQGQHKQPRPMKVKNTCNNWSAYNWTSENASNYNLRNSPTLIITIFTIVQAAILHNIGLLETKQ